MFIPSLKHQQKVRLIKECTQEEELGSKKENSRARRPSTSSIDWFPLKHSRLCLIVF